MRKEQDTGSSDERQVQIFELTMDNTEDQDELNRRFRKPGEPNLNAPVTVAGQENPTAPPPYRKEPRKGE